MALAEVVVRVASVNKTSVAAYAAAAGSSVQRQCRRPSGTKTASASAAMPERKLAICQGVIDMALMAAPPVENRKAAAISSSQLVARVRGTVTYQRIKPPLAPSVRFRHN